jgi:Mn2+/Fe2+ NRAMP family transporter
MIVSAVVFIFNVIKLLKTKYEKISLLLIVVLSVLFTVKFQFMPTGYYYFDYTSPQPDFKSAYESIPD